MFFSILLLPLPSTLFPYTTLFRSRKALDRIRGVYDEGIRNLLRSGGGRQKREREEGPVNPSQHRSTILARDRKSTRLNSSHRCISYAVFCLKKKNKNHVDDRRGRT